MGRVKFRKLTRSEYSSLKEKDPDTIYFVTADRKMVDATDAEAPEPKDSDSGKEEDA
ncbi:MAG: hypothetical protein LBC41_15285 [Clostridiales bacterium]|nr:hypothetical protein [Clostridiales bacterium]MDR2752017.1 hypothetical protein [Clostridiales bacterium]